MICQLDEPVSADTVTQVNAALFAPDSELEGLEGVRVCVVLGSANCAYRAERAVAAFAGRHDVLFVASGGNTAANGLTEARVLAQTLAALGVPDDRIIIEERSSNTRENLAEAERLVIGRVGGERGVVGDRQVAIVSAGFHRRRVLQCLPQVFAGAIYLSAFGPHTRPDNWHLSPYGREVIGYELVALSTSNALVTA
jgi:hypothetical protein